MFCIDTVLAGVVVSGLIGFALDRGAKLVERRATRWRYHRFCRIDASGQLRGNTLATLGRALAGLAVGVTEGVATGTAMAMSSTGKSRIIPA